MFAQGRLRTGVVCGGDPVDPKIQFNLTMSWRIVPRIVLDNSPLLDRITILPVKPELPHYDVGLCVLKRRLKSALIEALWAQLPN